MIPAILGGIGLFLLGMVLMTEGLKALAGDALRDVLSRFTGGPISAFFSGAALTALVQSSSATILATIGFVSAGLLTFTQAVGVIFGATVGTTSTGWLVAFLGLRYSVSALALPLVGIGALLRLLTRGRSASAGLALAGFGLIFVGIDTLQAGMQVLSERIDLTALGYGTFPERLLLVLIGVVMTVVMQSSSAAVATTLAALHAGTLALEQAAVLVIGQNIGTTVTAALAAIGASVPARRTALAHILLNAFSGVVALLALPLYLAGLARLGPQLAAGAAGSIAVFHTLFTLIGAFLLLPFLRQYTRLIARLVADPAPRLTRNLDASVRSIAPVAVEAARRTVQEIAALVVEALRALLGGEQRREEVLERLDTAAAALEETREFLAGVRTSPEAAREHGRHLSILHAMDHLERMAAALRDPSPLHTLREDATLTALAADLAVRLEQPLRWLQGESGAPPLASVEQTSRAIAETRRTHRPRVMERAAAGELDPDAALRQLDCMRWIDRLAYHSWRVFHHLAGGEADAAVASDDAVMQLADEP